MSLEDVLEHHGVKGMKWGVHKERLSNNLAERRSSTVTLKTQPGKGVAGARGGAGHEAHADAVKAHTSRQIAKRSTTDALSNKDLQDLVTRMNLEQQYKSLHEKTQQGSEGQKLARQVLKEHGPTLAVAGLKKTGHPGALALATGVEQAIKLHKAVSGNNNGGNNKKKNKG